MMTKKQIRDHIFEKRDSMSDEQISSMSGMVAERLMATKEYMKASDIFIYVGCRHEVETEEIIEASFKAGKRIAVPKVTDAKAGIMEFYYISSFEQLKLGYYGIMEPQDGEKAEPKGDGSCLIVMPGVAFGRDGARIGYGGGFYDRYLARSNGSSAFALAFDFQIIDSVPSESTDLKPDMVVTETEIFPSRGSRI